MHLYIVLLTWIITQVCVGLSATAKQSGRNGEIRGGGGIEGGDSADIKRYPIEALERLSKVFGISKIPKHLQHGTPPEYMIKLFNSVAYDDGITKKIAPYNANTVRGVPDRALHQQILYYFNLSHVKTSENILEAEFHIFKVSHHQREPAASPQRVGHVVELKLYQIIDPTDPVTSTDQKLLHHRRVSIHERGWEVFSVKDTVKQWVNDGDSNNGFLIETTTVRGGSAGNKSVQHIRFAQRSEHHDSKQPLLVMFTEDNDKLIDLESKSKEQEDEVDVSGDKSVNQPAANIKEILQDSEEINEQQEEEENNQGVSPAAINNSDNSTESQITNNPSPQQQTNNQSPQQHQPQQPDNLSKLRKSYVRFLNEEHRAQHGRFPNQRNIMSPELHRQLISGQLTGQSRTNSNRGGRQKRGASHGKLNRRRKKTCSLHDLNVDFEEIGWSGWIISPKGYKAYHCKGACQFPLGQNQQPTNHATVQSIVNAFRAGRDVGTPCCVPNQLFSISLLYFDDQENVILKQYDDMVANSCGCH